VSSSTGRRVGRVGPGASRADHAPFASRAKGRRRFRLLREEGWGGDRGARAEDAVNFASREDKLRARFIKDETFVVDASECV
jgi:hypothetical protein